MEHDDITRYLASLEREERYLLDATLKESAHELTQRVFLIDANGTRRGPYIRKFIDNDAGTGMAYECIFEAQQRGQNFKHIPTVFDCYRREDCLVVVMEHIDGETLQDRVFRHDPSADLAADVFPSLCDAVAELHESFNPPLIHRDLKPSNVMLSNGKLTLIDFGIARVFKEGADVDTAQFGTRAFAPPEQFGFGQTTVRSDIYALGMLLYYCLTEKIPTSRIRDAHFEEADVPACLRPILVRATAFDPDERYASARELKAAFLEAIAKLDSNHRPKMSSRRVIITSTCITVALAVPICIGIATGTLGQQNDQAELSAGAPIEAQPSEAAEQADVEGQQVQRDENDATQDEVLEALQTNAPQRNGFDPATNIATTIAGVQFQIPRYFAAKVEQGEGNVKYYYAESGSSLAMIMTAENDLSADSSDDLQNLKDSYLAGVIQSNEELFSTILSSTDCELAGHTARIVTLKGTTKELTVTTKLIFFINQDGSEGANTIGTIVFGQTDNVQLDCSTDFANTIASAIPA